MSLLQERSHQAGRRWNISGSVIAAFEPFLLSLSDNVLTLWDRRDGSAIQDMSVGGQVLSVVAALKDVRPGQTTKHIYTDTCCLFIWNFCPCCLVFMSIPSWVMLAAQLNQF